MSKYLDSSITESYTEITMIQDDFYEMKRWLIKKYGSVVPIARGCLKAIAKLTIPNKDNLSATVTYLRAIHRLLVNLSDLELSKGHPVPDLQDYLSSKAFLSALIETVPHYIKMKFFKGLLKLGIDDTDTIRSHHYLPTIIHLIKQHFQALELMIKSSPNPPPQTPAQQPSKKANKPATSTHVKTAALQPTQLLSPPSCYTVTPSIQNGTGLDGGSATRVATTMVTGGSSQPKKDGSQRTPNFLTGGNSTPIGQSNQNSRKHWPCLISSHRNHTLQECQEFWGLSTRERRFACRYGGCYTCLGAGRDCRDGCVYVQDVPAELICTDCAA